MKRLLNVACPRDFFGKLSRLNTTMTPEFNKKSVNSKTLGERLREIRERAGVSVEEIANAIKVNKEYLKKIESDDYENMPSEIYIRGFLRNYSNFLGIEAKDVLKIYEKERGIANNIKKNTKKDQFKKKRVKIPTITLSSRAIFGVVFGFFVLMVGWYFYKEAGEFAETPRLLISKPLNNSITEQSSTELVGVTDVGNQVTVNGRTIFVNEKGEFRERIILKNGINELVVRAVNKFNKDIKKNIKLSARYDEQIPNKNNNTENTTPKQEKENDKVKLVVKSKDVPVWIAVKVDGTNVYNGTILVGAEQVFEGEKDITITSGLANQTLIKTNNENDFHELADIPGVIRDVVFKKQSSQEANKEIMNADTKEGVADITKNKQIN